MLKLLLNETFFLALLLAGAALTPLAAFVVAKRGSSGCPRRVLIAVGALGPLGLALWGVHTAVLATLGFDSVASALVILGTALAIGVSLGLWVRGGACAPSSDRE